MRFWQCLKSANFTDHGRIFALADDTTFLGLPSRSSKLYVREEYELLWTYILDKFVRRGITTKILITGNPGIGKSMFALLILYYLATLSSVDGLHTPHIIIWQRTASGARYLFRDDGNVFEGGLDDFRVELKCPKTWCVLC